MLVLLHKQTDDIIGTAGGAIGELCFNMNLISYGSSKANTTTTANIFPTDARGDERKVVCKC